MNNEYTKQARKFLTDTGTTLEIVEAIPQKAPLWAKKGERHGINYTVTLQNERAKYTFDFWDSIANSEIIEAIKNIKRLSFQEDSKHYQAERFLQSKGINWRTVRTPEQKNKKIAEYMPNEYDILACLSPLYEDTLEDFYSAFGYEEDSITALKTFDACKEQDRNLRKLFTLDELEALNEIQ